MVFTSTLDSAVPRAAVASRARTGARLKPTAVWLALDQRRAVGRSGVPARRCSRGTHRMSLPSLQSPPRECPALSQSQPISANLSQSQPISLVVLPPPPRDSRSRCLGLSRGQGAAACPLRRREPTSSLRRHERARAPAPRAHPLVLYNAETPCESHRPREKKGRRPALTRPAPAAAARGEI